MGGCFLQQKFQLTADAIVQTNLFQVCYVRISIKNKIKYDAELE